LDARMNVWRMYMMHVCMQKHNLQEHCSVMLLPRIILIHRSLF